MVRRDARAAPVDINVELSTLSEVTRALSPGNSAADDELEWHRDRVKLRLAILKGAVVQHEAEAQLLSDANRSRDGADGGGEEAAEAATHACVGVRGATEQKWALDPLSPLGASSTAGADAGAHGVQAALLRSAPRRRHGAQRSSATREGPRAPTRASALQTPREQSDLCWQQSRAQNVATLLVACERRDSERALEALIEERERYIRRIDDELAALALAL
jgi:hypothetical protein